MRVKVNVLICILIVCVVYTFNKTGTFGKLDSFFMLEKKYPDYWTWLNQYRYTYRDGISIKIFPIDKETFSNISLEEKELFVAEVQNEIDDEGCEYGLVDFMDGTGIKVDSDLYYGELTQNYRMKNNAERVNLDRKYVFCLDDIEKHVVEINALGSYLVALSKLDVDVFVSVKDEGSSTIMGLSERIYELLGMKQIRELGYRYSYVFVSDKNGNKIEKSSKENIELEGKIDNINYHVISQGWDAGCFSSIILNGVETSQNSRGLNFAIVKKNGTLLDSVCFDTCDGKTIKRNS